MDLVATLVRRILVDLVLVSGRLPCGPAGG